VRKDSFKESHEKSPSPRPGGGRAGERGIAIAVVAVLAILLAWLLWPRPSVPPRAPDAPRRPSPSPLDRSRPAAPPAPEPAAVLPQLPLGAGTPAAARGPDDRGSFAGRVVSASTGEPVPGAEVVFARGGAASQARTDRAGAFRFDPPARGVWTLAAARADGFLPFAPEWGTSPVLLDARPGAHVTGIVVRLEPAVAFRGEVRGPEDRPVAGAQVRLLGAAAGDAALIALPGAWVTDAAGAFTFVAPEGATLEARAAGFAPARARVDLAARVTRRIVLRLSPGEAAPLADVQGTVQGAGAPLAGALVRAFDGGDVPIAEAVTDDNGAFTLRALSRGRHALTASAPGYAPATRWGVPAPSADVVLKLERGGRLAGRVVDARTGAPVVPFTVVAYERRGLRLDRLRSLSVADADGRFEMDGLPPGGAVVVAASPTHAPSPGVDVEVPEPGASPAAVTLRLSSGGAIEGRVVDRASRAPIAGAEVEVEGLLAEGSVVPVRQRALSDGGGRFRVEGLPEGRSSLSVSAEGHHTRVMSGLAVSDGATSGPVEIQLTPVAPGEDPHVELAGIGAVLMARQDALVVGNVAAGGGAAEAGLQRGDRIVSVDGQPVAQLGFAGSIEAIRGPEGSTVVLGVRRGEAGERSVTVPRRLVRN
jgi:membrane-associated protease RseP (regulator of RpoE activity)